MLENNAGDKRNCHNCSKPGHIAKNCPSAVICKFCGEEEHLSYDCTHMKDAKTKFSESKKEEGGEKKEDTSTSSTSVYLVTRPTWAKITLVGDQKI